MGTILTLTRSKSTTNMKSFAVLLIFVQLGIFIPQTSAKPMIEASLISSFETAILRCCSSVEDSTGFRCFELNGHGGVNFTKNVCKYLDSVLEKIKK